MKKLISLIAALTLVFSGILPVFAGTPETAQVTVTINKELSLKLTTAVVAFGNLSVDTEIVSSGYIGVENDGSGATETVKISVTNPTGWTEGATRGVEIYTIGFQFTTGTTKPALADANWKKASGITESLDYGTANAKNLWVKLGTPKITEKTTEQIVGLSISAE
ncbi:MAG: hypothetical protein NG740_02700 [Omnitrophica bacterium]|nr:hypothetical protein [Candidatus Omnitrophota bacterium]